MNDKRLAFRPHPPSLSTKDERGAAMVEQKGGAGTGWVTATRRRENVWRPQACRATRCVMHKEEIGAKEWRGAQSGDGKEKRAEGGRERYCPKAQREAWWRGEAAMGGETYVDKTDSKDKYTFISFEIDLP